MDEWMVATSAIAYITKLNKRKKKKKILLCFLREGHPRA
jgi:hypothetical protein